MPCFVKYVARNFNCCLFPVSKSYKNQQQIPLVLFVDYLFITKALSLANTRIFSHDFHRYILVLD